MAEAAEFDASSGLLARITVEIMDKSKASSAERFRKLYPELPEHELGIAQENFRRYVELALRIYEAIQADPERYAQFRALTTARRAATMKPKSPSSNT